MLCQSTFIFLALRFYACQSCLLPPVLSLCRLFVNLFDRRYSAIFGAFTCVAPYFMPIDAHFSPLCPSLCFLILLNHLKNMWNWCGHYTFIVYGKANCVVWFSKLCNHCLGIFSTRDSVRIDNNNGQWGKHSYARRIPYAQTSALISVLGCSY